MKFIIDGSLKETTGEDSTRMPFVEVLTKEEYREKYRHLVKDHLLLRSMENISHCKVDMFKRYILGTLCVPEKEEPVDVQWCCGFYMDEEKLILLGDGQKNILTVLKRIEKYRIVDMKTPAHVLFEFLESLVVDDVEFADELEKRLDAKEDEMVEEVNEIPKDFEGYILRTRKELTVWNRYYRQLYEMGEFLATCPNKIIDEDAKEMFSFFANKVERLYSDTQMLREYALQLRDMYQSRIDVRQNKVVQFLTIVTTIFMPLTLITGWYGMNFAKMPELHWVHGYGFVILAAVVIIIFEWRIFKKKKWL